MPTKRYDRIWDTTINSATSANVYTEVLWTKQFGSCWLTMPREMYDHYVAQTKESDGCRYFKEYMDKNNIVSVTLN